MTYPADSYRFLAGSYDEFTTDIDYTKWADYLERHFHRLGLPGRIVLDLACGTGSLTCQLARRGYDMIGVDHSPDMLAMAQDKISQLECSTPPILLCQPMEQLDLYGTMDACVCCLDSVNYVTDPAKLREAFQRVHLFLMPGGLFIFDTNSLEKYQAMDDQIFLDETEDSYCVWRVDYAAETRECSYFMDIFRRQGNLWQRGEELHRQRYYPREQLHSFLTQAGFTQVEEYGAFTMASPQPGESRTFFVARKALETESTGEHTHA